MTSIGTEAEHSTPLVSLENVNKHFGSSAPE
jgi:hypothetical protein